MVHSRLDADRIASGTLDDNDGALSQGDPVELPPGDRAAPLTKKRRRRGAERPKKRRRGEQRGLCQLNLDDGFPFVVS